MAQTKPAGERRQYLDIPLTSTWHPEILRSINVDKAGLGRKVETAVHPDLSSYVGPPMPGVCRPTVNLLPVWLLCSPRGGRDAQIRPSVRLSRFLILSHSLDGGRRA